MSLVTQGREPRRQMVLRPQPGSKQVVTATHASAVTVETGGRSEPAPRVPATRMTFIIHVHSVSPEGDVGYDFTLDAVDLLVQPGTSEQNVDAFKQSLAFLPGLTGKGTAGRRGNTLQLALPTSLEPARRKELNDLARALQFVGNPFPQEAIGVGARWEQPLYGSGPMAASGTANFELAAVQGDRLTTRFLIQQTSRDQPVPSEYQMRTEGGERMMLRSQTKGETLFRLDRLWPARSEMEMRVQADLSAEKEDPPRRMRIITDVKVLLEEKDG
ncbi:hypothetical protein JY651_51085 [Pyxidicoccus parkwayensis]|uniref:Uncharacterized protein n=1 Tax=Pyxidicoccus parkwayensis TaxID=2813578 RepID=A0ABX7P0S0_9BACT|nr:hypothetical protein [Pyxidicoccus parkwaysis]QSQ23332.1 hypothetical protein JY651_51085 [Pyxidicoccus parkwaysis]